MPARLRKELAERMARQVRQIENDAQEAGLAAVESGSRVANLLKRQTPLEHMLEIMLDDRRPPTFRFEAAKAAAVYVHPRAPEKKADVEEVHMITEIRRTIVHPEPSSAPAWRSERLTDEEIAAARIANLRKPPDAA